MTIEVYLTGHHVDDSDVQDRTVVVVDVLRTSTTIVSALANGARDVVPASDLDEAGTLAANLDPESYCLGGERLGKKIIGYLYGNSPLEYDSRAVDSKTVILTTTNGTPAIQRARHAEHLIVGGFVNVSLVAQFIREKNRPAAIVCAGWRNRISLEDTLCAGMILHELWAGVEPPGTADAAHVAFALYESEKHDIGAAVRGSTHGQRLAAMGLERDVDFCGTVDAIDTLPLYRDRRLVRHQYERDEAFA